MNGKAAVFCGVWLGVAACNGGQESPPADPLEEVFHRQSQEEGLSRDQTEGKRLFVHYCVTCHGEAGRGDGQNAYNLDPRPPDFSESLREHPPTYWRDIIEGGTAAVGRSPLCPPWGRNVTDEKMDALVSYLGVLAQSSSPAPGEAGAASSPPEKP